jgi:hypothetical protein
MQPPFSSTHSLNQACRLHRALYGLKQALWDWFAKFSFVDAQHGFAPNTSDHQHSRSL